MQHLLFHDFFVVDRIADIDITFERGRPHGGVKIDDIWDVLFGVKIGIDALHESRLSRTCQIP